MKKVLFVLVALALVAAPAMGAVKGSKHDLSSATGGGPGGTGIKDTTSSTEICVYCHTPHNAAVQAGTYLPLWNRSIVTLSVTTVYNTSSSLSSAARAVTTANVAAIDAALCLSCHDGASLTDPLNNPSNADGQPNIGQQVGATAVIDGDFNNDHPVAFSYPSARSEDNELVDWATVSASLPFFGTSNDQLWCSTCHDVHMGETQFMVKSNTGSALCYECHIK